MGIVSSYSGKNICFYYYGQDHLVVNLFKYIKGCLEKNIFVNMYIDRDVYDLVVRNLTDNEKQMVTSVPLDIEMLKSGSLEKNDFNSIIKKLKEQALSRGYFGTTVIVDVVRILKSIHNNIFEEMIKKMTDICNTYKMNMLTCYDFIDYTDRGRYISEDIMKMSYLNHNFRLFSGEIIPVENFILHNEYGNKVKI